MPQIRQTKKKILDYETQRYLEKQKWLKKMYKEYKTPDVPAITPTPKKKKKTTIRGAIDRIKSFLTPKRKKGITPPSGYVRMTPEQRKEWQEIMEQTK